MCFAIALTSMPGVCWKKARDFSHLNIRSRSSANQSNVDICIVAWRRPKENTIMAEGCVWVVVKHGDLLEASEQTLSKETSTE